MQYSTKRKVKLFYYGMMLELVLEPLQKFFDRKAPKEQTDD